MTNEKKENKSDSSKTTYGIKVVKVKYNNIFFLAFISFRNENDFWKLIKGKEKEVKENTS